MDGAELRRNFDDAGKLVLRVAVGAMVLLHGIAKVRYGIGSLPGLLEQHGLPGALAYGAYVGEVLGPLLMIAGAWTRVGALLVVANMLFAIGLVHAGEIFALGKQGGWAIELQGLMLFGAAAVALLGAGRFSLGRLMRGDGPPAA
jgi:putative oxidoreductase